MKKRLLGLLLALSLGIMATACGSGEAAAENDTGNERKEEQKEEQTADVSTEEDELKAASQAEIDGNLTITLGDQRADIFLWKVAQAKGFFDEEFTEDNISVEVQTFASGPAIFEAVAAGGADIDRKSVV